MNTIDLRKHEHLIYDYSYEDDPDRSQFFMHEHTNLEIYYLIQGTVEYHIENSTYHTQPGDIMIMRPGELHASSAEAGKTYERFNLRFSPELLKENLNSRLLLPFTNRPLGVFNHYQASEIPSAFIRSCFDRIFAQPDSDSEMRTMTYLLPILQEIYDVWLTRDVPRESRPVSLPAKIISYINQHLADLESPQQLSEALYMSQSQIYRVFREYTGTSVWDYVRTKRLIAVRDLMKDGALPGKAAAEYGFQNYSSFYRAYLKHFGHSPKEDYASSGK